MFAPPHTSTSKGVSTSVIWFLQLCCSGKNAGVAGCRATLSGSHHSAAWDFHSGLEKTYINELPSGHTKVPASSDGVCQLLGPRIYNKSLSEPEFESGMAWGHTQYHSIPRYYFLNYSLVPVLPFCLFPCSWCV